MSAHGLVEARYQKSRRTERTRVILRCRCGLPFSGFGNIPFARIHQHVLRKGSSG